MALFTSDIARLCSRMFNSGKRGWCALRAGRSIRSITGPSGGDRTAGRALHAPGSRLFQSGPRPMQVSLLLVFLLLVSCGTVFAAPPGTIITNTAQADFLISGVPQTVFSNSVSTVTVLPGTSSTLELFRYAPSSPSIFLTVGITSYFNGAVFTPAPAPSDPATATSIDLSVPVPLEPAGNFSPDDPVFARLADADGNLDPAVADTLSVTVEDTATITIETLLLTETGLDTGVFTGYIRSGAPVESANDGILYGFPGAQFSAEYTDPTDSSDTSSASFVFDATGILWTTASAGKNTVSVGDYLTYTITVENTSGATIPATVVTTDLPLGFRYEAGSTSIGGLSSPDPMIAPDGRSMAFSVGDLPPGGTVTITFVSRVGAGALPGRAVAPNIASSGALLSNTALATVRVTEELFRSRNVIMGRVLSGVCGEGDTGGVAGIRLFLEDGTYVVTDQMGRYHFEGVHSGTHVVQLDLETVPEMYDVVACDEDTRQARTPWSRFVDLAGGSLWRVDFNLTPKTPMEGRAVLVLKTMALQDRVTFSANMTGEQVPLQNIRFRVNLSEGMEYVRGTAMLEGVAIGDPEVQGSTLVWNVGDVSGAWEKGITFETKFKEGWQWSREEDIEHLDSGDGSNTVKLVQGEMNEVVSSASVIFDTPIQKDMTTPPVENVLLKVAEREETRTRKFVFRPHFGTFEASLSEDDRKALDIISALFDPAEIGRVHVTGHTDNVPISARGQRLYADNHALSRARARSMARYLRSIWDLPSGLFIIDGKGPDEPLASNDTVRGRTLNRRVEVTVIITTIEKRSELVTINDQNTTEIIIKGVHPGPRRNAAVERVVHEERAPDVDPLKYLDWFASDNGTLRWVKPGTGFLPHIPSLKIAVVHPPDQRVRIELDGKEINPLHFDSTVKNDLQIAALSIWRGVDIVEGDNRLTAVALDASGKEVARIEQTVHYSGSPVTMKYRPDLSRLTADGLNSPRIAIRLTDMAGYPARRGVMGQYYVDPPHRTLQQAEADRNEDLSGRRGSFSTYFVGEDGMAYLELEPTSLSGEAVVNLWLEGEKESLPVWLNSDRQEWILVGLAEGTVGYNTLSGNMESLEDAGDEEDLYTDGRTAFFAKGKVKGEYLLTMKYDTAGPHGAAGEGLHGTIDPDTYYTLYGDSTEQGYEAPTSGKLYLKLERKQFYALFGDTDTGLTVTELSRYDRRMTGMRSELRGETFSYNLFASETRQAFMKDEIPGDGTSGRYKLSNSDVVVNSESVRIEVRDRFQSHVILSVQELARHIDYNIDYDEGTLFFKSPVSERDSGFNPVYIVVDYETSDPDATGITYGARAQIAVPGSLVTVGVSYVNEDKGEGDGELVGVDVSAKLNASIELRAETAETNKEVLGTGSDGSAYVVELAYDSAKLKGMLYVREQDPDFGLGQQMASEAGMRKSGADARYRLNNNLSLLADVFMQENLETGHQRHVEEAGALYEVGQSRYRAAVRQATDEESDGTEEISQQLTAGVDWHSEDRRWELRADHDQSLADNGNTAYPTRTLLGADYRLSGNASLYAEQEFTDGDGTSVNSSRVGFQATPWRGGAVSSTVDRAYNENGDRVYATTGLKQTWQASERLALSAGFEGAKVLDENLSEPLNVDAAPVSPAEDYAAVSVGAGYRWVRWDFDVRLEARNAETSDKWGVISGLFGEPADGIGISTDLKHFRTEADTGINTKETDVRLGFVYRPFERKWTLLDRLDYVIDEEKGGTADLNAWKLVNNFNANLKASDDLQVSFQYGAKYVKDTVEGQVYDGLTQLLGAEGRYDLTPRWDVGAWTSILTAIDAGTTDYGVGASLGYGLMENMWLSFGYNLHGFTDSDFSQGDFTAQGPYIKFRLKFDQEDLKSILK
ncbi:MAG: OmpA family protein [bacterium]|nr:OmpA family protein [bacterium]